MAFHHSKAPDPRTPREVLQSALAFDFSHEYVITSKGLHLRHVEKTFICGVEVDDPSVEVTPYGGVDLCKDCAKAVPPYVKWKPPAQARAHNAALDLKALCALLNVQMLVTNVRPEVNDTGAAPCGAILGSPFEDRVLFVGHKNEVPQPVHRVGALHELTHVFCAPFGFSCEPGSGFYAVQYALGLVLKNNRYLLRATKEVQGLACPVYGGLMQARAWALGLLDEGRNANWSRLGLEAPG